MKEVVRMKKAAKAAAVVLGAAASAGATVYGLASLIDGLLVNRNMVLPGSFNRKISGADTSPLEELTKKNMQWLEEYGYERHFLENERGEKLAGYLVRPEKPSKTYVFAAHGYRSEGRKEYCYIAQYYLEKGLNVFFPDHTSAGASEGKYVGFGYYESRDSLLWLSYLKENFGEDIRMILHGISMGAATVMLMSGSEQLPENVKFIVSDCGYTSAWNEFDYKLHTFGVSNPKPILDAINFVNKRTAGYDFKDTSAVDAVKKASVPMLFVHGGADDFVPTYMVNEVYEACASERKELLIVKGADHAQSYVDGTEEYREALDRYIEEFITCEERVGRRI